MPRHQVFTSPDSAAKALIQAIQQNDTAQVAAIFGPQGQRGPTSGDASQDQSERHEFAQLAQTKYQLESDPTNPDRVVLAIGPDDWPFPVPIVRTKGGWMFDPSQGELEMQARRIGADELDTIQICSGFVDAEQEYAMQAHSRGALPEYAQHIMSSGGQHDGLYWGGATQPLVPRGFAEADASGPNPNPRPYHGYYFSVLRSQGPDAPGGAHEYVLRGVLFGGFALVGWPAEYGVTGIHTFIVNQSGTVFEKDMGPPTSTLAPAMKAFNPDGSWMTVE